MVKETCSVLLGFFHECARLRLGYTASAEVGPFLIMDPEIFASYILHCFVLSAPMDIFTSLLAAHCSRWFWLHLALLHLVLLHLALLI